MLEKRADFLSETELKKADKGRAEGLYRFVQILTEKKCKVFVKESNDRWRFVHQSMREYALAWNLNDGLHNPGRWSALKGTSSLDYESAETYQKLKEILPASGLNSVILRLRPRLENVHGNDEEWNNLARNYFEAVGMLG